MTDDEQRELVRLLRRKGGPEGIERRLNEHDEIVETLERRTWLYRQIRIGVGWFVAVFGGLALLGPQVYSVFKALGRAVAAFFQGP